VAVLSGAAETPRLLLLHMPILKITVGKKQRKRIDVSATIAMMFALQVLNVELVLLEDVGGITGQSASAAFSFGKSCGYIEAATVAAKLPLQLVTPQTWQKRLGVQSGHDNAKQAATRLFPEYAAEWRHDGKAAAALIALYGARYVLP
jgi:hypothetical protein